MTEIDNKSLIIWHELLDNWLDAIDKIKIDDTFYDDNNIFNLLEIERSISDYLEDREKSGLKLDDLMKNFKPYKEIYKKVAQEFSEIKPSDVQAELRNAHNIIKQNRKEIQALRLHRNKPTRDEMKDYIDDTRKKNGCANFEALARKLGYKDGTTVKNMIKNLRLIEYTIPPHKR